VSAGREAAPAILLLGAEGQVGWELQRTLATLGRLAAWDRRRLDLSDPEAARRAVIEARPDVIVNAAAYTAVDRAESQPEQAMAVNARAPGALAEAAARIGAALVHYSTDYVFDGAKGAPYTEDDAPAPLGVYARSKRQGEEAVAAAGAPHLVLRTSWVYGLRRRNFLRTVMRLAAEGRTLRIVDDQVGSPTPARLVAETTAQILAQARGRYREFLGEHGGLYHCACAGATSWYGFADRILEHLRALGRPAPDVEPIPSAEYPTPAPRPPYSVLDGARLAARFALNPCPWERALALVMDELAAACD